MTTTKTAKKAKPRPMSDRGQGRKPIAADGEVMKVRYMRLTEAQWAEAKRIGPDAVRTFLDKSARKS